MKILTNIRNGETKIDLEIDGLFAGLDDNVIPRIGRSSVRHTTHFQVSNIIFLNIMTPIKNETKK